MSRAPLSAQMASDPDLRDVVVDSLGLAREGREIGGQLAVADLPRVLDLVKEQTGSLQVGLLGDMDDQGRPWLHLTVKGALHLQCQRCLVLFVYPLAIEAHMRLISLGEAWPEDELEDGSELEADDAIAADSALRVRDLVEEEIILGLPYAPMHDVCNAPGVAFVESAVSPFAALAALKKH